MCDCVFCRIIQKKSPAHIVKETKNMIAILDIAPIHEGHVIILPKLHADSIHQIPMEVITEVMETAQQLAKTIKKQ